MFDLITAAHEKKEFRGAEILTAVSKTLHFMGVDKLINMETLAMRIMICLYHPEVYELIRRESDNALAEADEEWNGLIKERKSNAS